MNPNQRSFGITLHSKGYRVLVMPGLNLISNKVETLNQLGAREHIHGTMLKLVPGSCGTESLRNERQSA